MNYPPPGSTAGAGGAPPCFPPPPPPAPALPPLPPGWERAADPATGRLYYANRTTGETSWEPPPPPYFPPPPPPPPVVLPRQQQFQPQTPQFHHEPPTPYGGAPPAIPSRQPPPKTEYDAYGNPVSMPPDYPPNPNNTPVDDYSQQYVSNQQPQPQVGPPQAQYLPTDPRIPPQELQPATTHASSSGLGHSTATTPGLLVPSIRAAIESEHARRSAPGASVPKLELEGLSAGAVADLCNVTRELRARDVDGGDFAGDSEGRVLEKKAGGAQEDEGGHYYTPLRPFALPVSSLAPHIEQGRVDIRLHALHTKLGKI